MNKERKVLCPQCGECSISVIDTRMASRRDHDVIRRRRKCDTCGHRYSTLEVPAEWIASRGRVSPPQQAAL
jgi:transcriptional regulator NrdR family protein